MSGIIRIDYDQMKTVAARFRQQADAIGQMSQAVYQSQQKLQSGGWVGQGADAFFKEMETDVRPAVLRLQEALARAAEVSDLIGTMFDSSEQEASSPFNPSLMEQGSGGMGEGMAAGMGGGGMGSGADSGAGSGGGLGAGSMGAGGAGGSMGSSLGSRSGLGSGYMPSGGGYGSGYGGGLGGSMPSGGLGSLFAPGSSSAEGAGTPAAAMRFQSLGGGGGGGGDAAGHFVGGAGGGVLGEQAAAVGGMGMPIALAMSSPFLALLGKAVQKRDR